jgi:sulfoxide reductase heme-binding subunit YedZ
MDAMEPNRKIPISPGPEATQLAGPRAATRLPARDGLVFRRPAEQGDAANPPAGVETTPPARPAATPPARPAATPPARPAATPLPARAISLAARPLGAPTPLVARPLGAPTPRPPSRAGSAYRGLPEPIRIVGWIAIAIAVGAVLGATAPTALDRIGAVAAVQPGLLAWYTVRALGFMAYLVLAGSVLYGLLLSTKILDAIAHRPVSFALHKDLAIVALILGTLHGVMLTYDQSFAFTPLAILIPFESPYSPISVGVGQLTLYLSVVVTASFYVRRHIGQKTWRMLHYATFLAFIGASAHGIASGSDSGAAWAFWLYLAPITAAIFLLTYRIVVGLSNRIYRPRVERAGIPGAIPMSRGPLDRPGAASGGFPWPT